MATISGASFVAFTVIVTCSDEVTEPSSAVIIKMAVPLAFSAGFIVIVLAVPLSPTDRFKSTDPSGNN